MRFTGLHLAFMVPNFTDLPLSDWLRGVRPMLNLVYWANYKAAGLDPYWFHAINLLLHGLCGVLAYLVARKIFALNGISSGSGFARIAPAAVAAIFLVHPLQTESVAYVAGRSELMCGIFLLLAWVLYLYRDDGPIGFLRSSAVLIFFVLALATKEHAVVLPAVLLLCDYTLHPDRPWETIRRNWKLYAPLGAGAIVGAVLVFLYVLRGARTAGFGVAGLSPQIYLYTQFRALVKYVSLFLFPVGQSVDHDFPISRSLWEHGSWAGLLVLVGIAGTAFHFRKKIPVLFLGAGLFFIFLAPTSSVVPIQDVFVERRLYLPVFALSLLVMEGARRLPLSRSQFIAGMVLVVIALSLATWRRNHVWGNAVGFWADTAESAPTKFRPRFQLAYALYQSGECARAVEQFTIAEKLSEPNYELFIDWALAADCASRPQEAERLLQRALAIERTAHAHALLGMVHGKQGHYEKALEEIATAVQINPRFATPFLYKGNVHQARQEYALAEEAYRHALEIEPNQAGAAEGLQMARLLRLRAERKAGAGVKQEKP
jgi:protein O-mannosyl-transferase